MMSICLFFLRLYKKQDVLIKLHVFAVEINKTTK